MDTIKDKITLFTKGDPHNPPIIFIHGFPFDHLMWNNQVNALSSNYFCVLYDIRGLGTSKVNDGQFTIEMFTEDLFNIIKEFDIKKPVLCTLSMGGYIALRAAEINQDIFGALILCDTKSEADNNEGKLKRAKTIKSINDDGLEKFIKEFVPNCFAEESIEKLGSVYDETLERCLKFSAIGVKGCLLAMAGRTDTTEFLSEIKIPVLLICGEKDTLTPPDVMKKMSDSIKGGKFHLIKGAGHITPLESPEIVNKIILEFLPNKD